MSTTSEKTKEMLYDEKIKEKLFKIVSRLEEAIPGIKKMIEEKGFSYLEAGSYRSRKPIMLLNGVVAEHIELNEGEVRIHFFSPPEEN